MEEIGVLFELTHLKSGVNIEQEKKSAGGVNS
jgi:hypothetical protein